MPDTARSDDVCRGPGTDRRLFDGSDVASVGSVRDRTGSAGLPVTLTDEASADVAERFRAVGVPGTPDEFEVVQFHDGEAVGRFGIAPGLVEAIADGEWDGRLLLTFGRREQAVGLRETLADDGGCGGDSGSEGRSAATRRRLGSPARPGPTTVYGGRHFAR